MNILIYHPTNQAAKDLEALMEEYIKDGFKVYLLTHQKSGVLHANSKQIGANVFDIDIKGGFYYLRQIIFLVKFCKKHEIDIVYSNLQQCSIISIFAQYFMKAKVITWRHHSDSVCLYGTWKEKLIDKLINRFSEFIIVISNFSLNQILDVEKADRRKISLIPLGYNFNLFSAPSPINVTQIKTKYSTSLLIVIIGRLVPLKRVDLALEVVEELVHSQYDIKLLILGSGFLETELRNSIAKKGIQDNAFLIGHVGNVEDYMTASDLVIHISNSEASCHIPKEAGILEKSVLVCRNVGDFSDYLIDDFNGILIDKENTKEELKHKLIDVYEKKINIQKLGAQLKNTVKERFDIKNVIKEHKHLLTRMKYHV